MARYIDAEDFLDLFYVASIGQDKEFIKTVEMVVADTPTADVVEVKHGEWIHKNGEMYCSVCGGEALMDEVYYESPCCPDCGARMDGCKTEDRMTYKDCVFEEMCPFSDKTCVERCVHFKNKADFVEVVRCKDCKHRGDYGCPMYHETEVEWDDDGYTECETIIHDNTTDDSFCSYVKRGDRFGKSM